ncbi:chemotaxis protein CheW [Larsenimonas salina]|uniref:chemotaxis protein CheW n=1 Tax=Larsenimonas salina TaxID=1295565 RepID=UPI0020744ECD|nr:chemotaxis protein CheW [Larsenimonas salina]MCM5704000.1 chemotaxis protein CheW [Larsenimonas salina]
MSGSRGERGRFCLFEVGGSRLALDIASVQEIVPNPAQLTRAPRPEPFVLGMVRLRELRLPVIDLCALLALPATTGPAVLIVLQHQRQLVALRVDRVMDVVDAVPEPLGQDDTAAAALTPAALTDPDSGEPVYLLDIDALLALDGIQVTSIEQDTVDVSAHVGASTRSQALLVGCHDMQLALPSHMVREIQVRPTVHPPVIDVPGFVGTVELRGTSLALFSPLRLLGYRAPAGQQGKSMVVLAVNGYRFAIFVDRVIRMVEFEEAAVLPLADSSQGRDLFTGLLPHATLGESLLVSEAGLAQMNDLISIAGMYARAEQISETSQTPWRRFPFMHFKAQGQFVTPLYQLEEVIAMPETYLPAADVERGWVGSMSLRGQSVNLVDLRRLLGIVTPKPASHVLVVRCERFLIGFMIDTTRRIEYIDAPSDSLIIQWRGDNKTGAPPIERCKRLVSIGRGSHQKVLSVLCLQALARLLARETEDVCCNFVSADL